jgi:hypothetical protein
MDEFGVKELARFSGYVAVACGVFFAVCMMI